MKKFNNNIKKLLSTILFCLKISFQASPFYTLSRIFIKLFMPVSSVLNAYISKQIIDLITGSAPTNNIFYSIAFAFLFLFLLAITVTICTNLSSYAESMHTDIVNKYMNENLMKRAMSADLALYDNPEYYNKMNLYQKDLYSLVYILWNAIDLACNFFAVIGTFIIIAQKNALFGIAVIITSIPSAIAMHKFTKAIYNLDREQVLNERQEIYLSYVATSKEHSQDVRFLNLGGFVLDRYNTLWKTVFSKKHHLAKNKTIASTLLSVLPDITTFFIYGFIIRDILAGLNTVGDFTYYLGIISQLLSYTTYLIYTIMNVYENQLKVDRIREFEIIENQVLDNGTIVLDEIHTIELQSVSFSYPLSDKCVLNNISFKINDGEHIALVGINGSGKTTLIKLLLRFYDPTDGKILINGRNIKEYTLESLRSNFAAYLQNSENFGFTLRDNITIADLSKEISDEEITKVLDCSGFLPVMNKACPEGLDNYITRTFSETGAELSGGEGQKLALARAFYRRASAYILDEPSSSLDPEAESILFKNLSNLCEGKPTLFTSHRLSNITLADRIVVIENGVLLEEGTEKELLQRNGRYKELYKYQADKFTQDI